MSRIGPAIQESLPNNAARVVLPGVVLPGIVLLPVDVAEVRPHLRTQLHVGRVRQSPELFDQFGKLGGVLRHPIRVDHEYGEDHWADEPGGDRRPRHVRGRSTVGVRTDGSMVFVLGASMSGKTLANIVDDARAARARALDLNQSSTNVITYTHAGNGIAVPQMLPQNEHPNPYRDLQPSSRDFVAVLAR
jgi:hypothetical protein